MDRVGRLVLLSRNVFDATGADAFDGFVAIKGNKIEAVGLHSEAEPYLAKADQVIDAGDRVLMPGLTDNHTFFTGWSLLHVGPDLGEARDAREAAALVAEAAAGLEPGKPLFAHNWDAGFAGAEADALLEEAVPDRPFVAFTADRGACWINQRARERYQFDNEPKDAESTWRMMGDLLAKPEVKALYNDYMKMLNRRGVTQIKEMSFDDYYGFADVMQELEANDGLTVRVSLMSQPVGAPMDLEHGRAMQERFQGPFVSFSGFNRMTDRSIASGCAELKEPYCSDPSTCCAVPVEWGLVEDELARADAAGFRYTFHCQGDGAVAHVVDLYEKCARDESGHLVQRHAITDMEFSNPEDLERFGALGGICEVYPQIGGLDNADDVVEMAEAQIGPERFKNYWMRRTMVDAGCRVVGDTDLPLMLPSIGESIYCGCGGHMNDGVQLRTENTLTVPEMLEAWSANGAYDCYSEDRLGTLEPGKLADICVLQEDVLHADPALVRGVNAALTISDGRIVHNELED